LLINKENKKRRRQDTYGFGNINDRDFILGGTVSGFLRNECPQLVCVNGWAEVVVSLHVEHSHTVLSEVTGMTGRRLIKHSLLTICSS